jgi:hypothetical protein
VHYLISFRTLCLLSVLFAFLSASNAQQSTGALNGAVTDGSGAVIPSAQVVLSNQETGARRNTRTNGSGLYNLPDVPPGNYSLTVTNSGFQTQTRSGVVVGVNQTLTFNFTLMVGSQSSEITVQASVAQLEASTSELGTVIDSKTVSDLPLNGRQFTQLLLLTPGASRINTSQNSSGGRSPSTGPEFFPAMHGQNNRSNFFMLDGINDNEDLFSTYAVSPIADDIQEFKVQSHNDQAQFGGVLGGVINVVTKSGTNRLHGTLWEFNRNAILGADNPITSTKTPLNQNQFGGNIGGPVPIPHWAWDRGKTFFFFSYEGFRRVTASNSYSLVPTQAELNGDFSADTTQIYNPFTTAQVDSSSTYTRQAYANNQINPTSFNPVMLAYAKALIAAPNTSGNGVNYLNTTPSTLNQNNFNGRLDKTLTSKDSAWFRYSTQNQPSSTSSGYPYLLNNTDVNSVNYGVNYLHIFNPSLTLDLEFGHNLLSSISRVRYTLGSSESLLSKVPFNSAFACGYAAYGASENCLVPAVSITGYAGGGESDSFASPATSIYQWNADLSKVVGHHFIQFGGSFERDSFGQQAVGATVAFTAAGTSCQANCPDPNGRAAAGKGNALASFLLGVVDNSKDRVTTAPIDGQKAFDGYIQDQWKVTQALTLNFGMRYDLFFWPRYGNKTNNSDAIGEIDFSNGTYLIQADPGACTKNGSAPCIPGGIASVPGVVVSPGGHLWKNSYDNVQPRFGVAYQFSPKDVIRGAFGIFFDEWSGIRQTVQGIGGSWPSVAQPAATGQSPLTANPTIDPTNPLNGVASLPAANPFGQSTYYRDPHAKNPESEQWNLGVQHLVNGTTTLEINYVGSHSYRLPVGGGLYNVALTPGAGTAAQIAARRPYPNITPTRYDRSIGSGNYNGLEARLSQSEKHGLQYIISYTYSKTMNIACDGLFGVEGCSEPNPYNFTGDYSVAGYDLPQNLSVSGTYALPIGRNRALNISNAFANAFLGGWQVNAIYAATSGVPYSLTVSGDIANTGNTNQDRVDRIGNPHLATPNRAKWFNTAAFVTPANFTFGTESRNSLRGQAYQNLDASLFKAFRVREAGTLQFRADAFNALNHLTLGTPGTNISTPSSFGVITSERSTERIVQLAVKFLF